MHVLTRQAVRSPKLAYALPQRALVALKTLGVILAGSQLSEETLDQGRYRRVALGGLNTPFR